MELIDSSLLQDQLPDNWFDDAQNHFGLSEQDIVSSVQAASEFFNLDAPQAIHEGWTTGVMNGLPMTETDDILIFNREQLLDMGINDKMGFDLVMTHEGAHRALQGIHTGFSDHQEELCCDYMAGVRAGLNNMDEGRMSASLIGTEECDTHPDGVVRVEAIEAGVAFAHEYMAAHDGNPPSFSDCLEHFEQSDICQSAASPINLRPESGHDLDVPEKKIEDLTDKADGIERDGDHDKVHEYRKVCPTRHGCQGATDCNYSYGDYPF
jgi:hypothetical protein